MPESAALTTPKPRSLWHRFRRIWATFGILATIVFFGWSAMAYRANSHARELLIGTDRVNVIRGAHHWRFTPKRPTPVSIGVVFFPGGLVESEAYAPLLHELAAAGYPSVLIDLPRRGAFGGADSAAVFVRAHAAMRESKGVTTWVVAGHSLGGAVAARFAHAAGPDVGGLVLLGTSHPRDFDLAGLKIPVTKVLGTHDWIASIERSERNRHLLPGHTRWVILDGANHSQFGHYGFQPGDRFAAISRERQQELVVNEIQETLESASPANRQNETSAGNRPQ